MWRLLFFALLCFTASVAASERHPAKVRIFQERSTQAELIASVETDGKTHHLKLKKTLLPSVRIQELVVGANGSITVEEINQNQTRSFYEDERTGAVLFLNDKNTFEGMISDSVALHYENNEHSTSEINEKTDGPFCGVTDHSTFEKDLPKKDLNLQGENRAVSYIVELLVVADSKLTNYKAQYLEDYIKLYWKMVDRRFRTVTGASIQLRLNNIIVCTTTACDDIIMAPSNFNVANVYDALYKFAGYLAKYKSQLASFDVAHLMTSRDLYYENPPNYNVNGLGYVGRPCYVTADKAYNTGLSEDYGYYSGILTTAHEIGHNLGANHDPQDTTSCSWNYGYMMSYIRTSYRAFYFSPCSSQAMTDIYFQPYASCLKTISGTNWYTYPNYVAGLFITFNQQCVWNTGFSNAIARPGIPHNDQCYRLQCQYSSGGTLYYRITSAAGLEGTPCNTGGYCKDGRCQASWQ